MSMSEPRERTDVPHECCAGTVKTHESTADNGLRWLLCTRHAGEVEATGHLTVRRLRK